MSKKQIFFIFGSAFLIVLLFLANTKFSNKKGDQKLPENEGLVNANNDSLGFLVEQAKLSLNEGQRVAFDKMEGNLKSSEPKEASFIQIIRFWDSLRRPAIAAYYKEKSAFVISTEENWLEAGNRYFSATRFVKETEKQMLFIKAMACFNKTLEIAPNNVEAKINLGACYVEGSSDPMKGIGILREVEKIDSNNINLQLNFAFFSGKSGQWDKAIARFNKVLKIQPDYIEAYLHLADAYEQKGDKANAIISLEKYSALIEDVTIKAEVRSYIKKLMTG